MQRCRPLTGVPTKSEAYEPRTESIGFERQIWRKDAITWRNSRLRSREATVVAFDGHIQPQGKRIRTSGPAEVHQWRLLSLAAIRDPLTLCIQAWAF